MAWWSIIPNVLSAAFGLASSNTASSNAAASQREANATNLQIARETNEANKQLAVQQNEWNIQQWHRANEYNSPANQRKLWQEAGMNPVLMNGQFSPASELQSADLANQVPATVAPEINSATASAGLQGKLQAAQAVEGITDAFSKTLSNIQDAKLKAAQAGAVETLTPLQARKYGVEVENLLANTDSIKRMTDAQVRELFTKIDNYRASIALLEEQAKTEHEKVEYQKISNDTAKLENEVYRAQMSYLKEMPRAQLRVLVSTALKNYADRAKSFADADKSRADTEATNYRTQQWRETGRDIPSVSHSYTHQRKVSLTEELIFRTLEGAGVTPESVGGAVEQFTESIVDDIKSDTLTKSSIIESTGKSIGQGIFLGGM